MNNFGMERDYVGEQGYIEMVEDIFTHGKVRGDRTGTGTMSMFSPGSLRFENVEEKFPLFTTKKMAWKSILAETLWWAQGRFDLEYLRAGGCSWWDPWERDDHTLGRVYGAQMRHWRTPEGVEVDQLAWVINEIQTNPESRRLVMTMWNAGELDNMALPPCHGALIQFYVTDGVLDLAVNIRSSDVFLGLPTNVAGYALLLKMVAHETYMAAGDLVVHLGDAHIYLNHMDAVTQLLKRRPTQEPNVDINHNVSSVDAMTTKDFTLSNYNPQESIKAPISV